jgi:hypothetical protein
MGFTSHYLYTGKLRWRFETDGIVCLEGLYYVRIDFHSGQTISGGAQF